MTARAVCVEDVLAAYRKHGSGWKAGLELGISGQKVYEVLRQRGRTKPVSPICTKRGLAAAAALKAAQTHCKRGHLLGGDNLFRTSSGARGCKECRKIHKRTYREKSR